MEKMAQNREKKIVIGVAVALIIGVVFCIIHNATRPNYSPAPETTTEEIIIPDYRELYADRNIDETQVIIKIREGVDPYYRSEPVIMDSTVIGTIKAGQSLNVRRVYAVTTDENGQILWVGVKRAELQLEAQYTQEKTVRSDDDQIVWINGAYASVSFLDYDPGTADQMDYEYKTLFASNKQGYRIILSDCALRSSPKKEASNKYGSFKTTSYIYAGKVYTNKTNTYYGVPAKDIDVKYLEERIGNPVSDPDGIVWFSQDYVEGKIVKV